MSTTTTSTSEIAQPAVAPHPVNLTQTRALSNLTVDLLRGGIIDTARTELYMCSESVSELKVAFAFDVPPGAPVTGFLAKDMVSVLNGVYTHFPHSKLSELHTADPKDDANGSVDATAVNFPKGRRKIIQFNFAHHPAIAHSVSMPAPGTTATTKPQNIKK